MAPSQNSINAGYIKSVTIKNAFTSDTGIEVSDLVTELSIYQSIQVPFITGKLLIVDAVSLLDNIMLLGNEQITVTIGIRSTGGKDEYKTVSFLTTSIERLEKQKDTNVYALTFGSAHFLHNSNVRINQSYKGKSSEIVQSILKDNLGLSDNQLDIEDTSDNIKVVVPGLKIADALMWITRRAQSETLTPCFVFEHLDGSMAFNSLGKMYSRPAPFKYVRRDSVSTDPLTTYYSIIDMQIDNFGQGYKNISEGMFASTVYAFDITTKQISEEKFALTKYEKNSTTLNNALPDSGLTVKGKTVYDLPDAKVYNIITSSDGSNTNKPDLTGVNDLIGDYHTNAEYKIPYLNSKLLQLENFMMTIVVQGNINVFPGSKITIVVPSSQNTFKSAEKLNDLMYSGDYITASVRHIFTSQKHMTFIQLVKDTIASKKK